MANKKKKSRRKTTDRKSKNHSENHPDVEDVHQSKTMESKHWKPWMTFLASIIIPILAMIPAYIELYKKNEEIKRIADVVESHIADSKKPNLILEAPTGNIPFTLEQGKLVSSPFVTLRNIGQGNAEFAYGELFYTSSLIELPNGQLVKNPDFSPQEYNLFAGRVIGAGEATDVQTFSWYKAGTNHSFVNLGYVQMIYRDKDKRMYAVKQLFRMRVFWSSKTSLHMRLEFLSPVPFDPNPKLLQMMFPTDG